MPVPSLLACSRFDGNTKTLSLFHSVVYLLAPPLSTDSASTSLSQLAFLHAAHSTLTCQTEQTIALVYPFCWNSSTAKAVTLPFSTSFLFSLLLLFCSSNTLCLPSHFLHSSLPSHLNLPACRPEPFLPLFYPLTFVHTMGRKKIQIKTIVDERNRQVRNLSFSASVGGHRLFCLLDHIHTPSLSGAPKTRLAFSPLDFNGGRCWCHADTVLKASRPSCFA